MSKRRRFESNDAIILEAQKYNSKKELRFKDKGLCSIIQKRKLNAQAYLHMKNVRRNNFCFSDAQKSAKQFSNKTKFKKEDSYAFEWARKNKCLDQICIHMNIPNINKLCISCNKSKNVVHKGPRCVNCYRKEINPKLLDKIKEYNKNKVLKSSDRYSRGKAQAKERKIIWSLSKEDYLELNSKPCFYCGGSLPINGVGLDRISIDKKIGYSKENVIPCCTICNSIRGDKLTVSETVTAIQAVKEHKIAVIHNFHENNYHIDNRTVCIFGEINEIIVLQVQKAFDILESINKYAEITIKIMSEGGNWFDGLAIYDRIKSSPCPTRTLGTGMVASTATIIFQAGKLREITENCMFLLHDGTEGFEGEAKSFESHAEASKKSRQLMYEIYSKVSGKPTSFWQTVCLKDSILWKKEILTYGLADKILGE